MSKNLKVGDKCIVIGGKRPETRKRNVGKTVVLSRIVKDGEKLICPGETELSLFTTTTPLDAPFWLVEGDVAAFRRRLGQFSFEVYAYANGWSIVAEKYLMKIDGFEGNDLEANLYDKVNENESAT